jgi:anti-sigma factor RsiW
MKPCRQNRKLIVWLAANALDARQARQLQSHLETCEGCRRYLAEISNVTEKLVAAERNPNLQASENFYRNVARKLRSVKPASLAEMLATYFREQEFQWRVVLPAIAVLVLVIGVSVATRMPPPKSISPPPASQRAALESDANKDLAPTLANYQQAAKQSFDQLDALLAKQSKRALPAMPIYTASTRLPANELF